MSQFATGDRVVAMRDGRAMKQNEAGVVDNVALIDSEEYLWVILDNTGYVIGPTLADFWRKE